MNRRAGGAEATTDLGRSPRHLRTLGVVAPVVFVILLGLSDIALEEMPWWPEEQPLLRLIPFMVLAVGGALFAYALFRRIDETQARVLEQNRELASLNAAAGANAAELGEALAELHRGRDEGFAFYDILIKISNQGGVFATLHAIADHTRRLLGSDAAALVLKQSTVTSVRFDDDDSPEPCDDGTSVIGSGLIDHRDPGSGRRVNPIGCHHWQAETSAGVSASGQELGTLWIGRRSGDPFTPRDQRFLATMAGLSGIALAAAQLREDGRQRAVLAERTRIARETHDSHAQVLAAVHLRLRALALNPGIAQQPRVVAELDSLADACEEAYADVREVILALRDSDRPERDLESTLRSYCEKYSALYGIKAEFVNTVGPLHLSPRAEVELTRVVQEAMTNVRKHAGASTVTVTVTGSERSTTFTITDDGVGFTLPSVADAAEGYGLVTMRERLTLLGGTLDISSAPQRGTRVVAVVPEGARRVAEWKAS